MAENISVTAEIIKSAVDPNRYFPEYTPPLFDCYNQINCSKLILYSELYGQRFYWWLYYIEIYLPRFLKIKHGLLVGLFNCVTFKRVTVTCPILEHKEWYQLTLEQYNRTCNRSVFSNVAK